MRPGVTNGEVRRLAVAGDPDARRTLRESAATLRRYAVDHAARLADLEREVGEAAAQRQADRRDALRRARRTEAMAAAATLAALGSLAVTVFP